MLNFLSALTGLIGTIIIFIYGVPTKIDTKGESYMCLEGYDTKEISDIAKYKIISKLGLGSLILSFGLQMLSAIIPISI